MNGRFWLPEDPDNRAPGSLSLDPAEGVHLRLIGSLGRGGDAFFGANDAMPRILGEADGKYLTLVDGYQRNYRSNLAGTPPTQEIHANYAFVGARFDAPEDIAFSRMFLGLEDLTTWVGRSGIHETSTLGPDRVDRHAPVGTSLQGEEVTLDGYTLKLWHKVNWQHTRFRGGTLSERHRFTVVPDELTGWRDLMRVAGDLADLVSAAFHYPVAFDAICFEIPNAPGHQIDLHAQWQAQLGTRDKPPHRMTFTFDGLGGMQGVARWLTVATKHRRAISRIAATRREGRMYVEDRFMNCVAAAEGVHRRHVTTDKHKLFVRLTELVDLAGDEFKSAMPDHAAWVRSVVKERNEHAHHLDERVEREDPWLFYLGTSTYWLVLLCLLRIADAPKAVEQVGSCEQFDWDMAHLRGLMEKTNG